MATTTSLHDSGLLAEIVPRFEAETGIAVRVVAVGSGAALRMGAQGNADCLLTHEPEGERRLVEQGLALGRRPFMENHFLLVGPPDDPARVREAPSAAEGLVARIARAGAPWVSRGDESGTHVREQRLLAEGGLDPKERWPGFSSTGLGMGPTLQVANERRAYTLTDLGTFLAFEDRLELVVLSREEPRLPEGGVRVRVDGDHALAARAERPAGARVRVGIRPEHLKVDVGRGEGASIGKGVVRRVSSEGLLVRVEVEWGGQRLRSHLLAGRGLGRRLRPGDAVSLRARAEDVHLMQA